MKREVLQRAGPTGCSAEAGVAPGARGRWCGEAAATAALGPLSRVQHLPSHLSSPWRSRPSQGARQLRLPDPSLAPSLLAAGGYSQSDVKPFGAFNFH